MNRDRHFLHWSNIEDDAQRIALGQLHNARLDQLDRSLPQVVIDGNLRSAEAACRAAGACPSVLRHDGTIGEPNSPVASTTEARARIAVMKAHANHRPDGDPHNDDIVAPVASVEDARARLERMKHAAPAEPFDVSEFVATAQSNRFAARHPGSELAQELAVNSAYRAGKRDGQSEASGRKPQVFLHRMSGNGRGVQRR